jgi:cobalt/nickel transport system ATP-binding protein
MAMIELKNINFAYHGGDPVLKDINFELQQGQRIGLIGPNGTGKSTFMQIIMGLLIPTSGELNILGSPRKVEDDFLEVRENIGFLFQDSEDQLFCPTVEEDIAFGPLNLGRTHSEAADDVKRALATLALEGMEQRITHKLSGGEKKLVALASIIAMNPKCLLLDEPTAGLDKEKTEILLDYLKNHMETYILISHNKPFLEKATDQVFSITE